MSNLDCTGSQLVESAPLWLCQAKRNCQFFVSSCRETTPHHLTRIRFRRRVSYLLAWREVFSTQAFCTKPCHGCCSPPEHSMSDGATDECRISIGSNKFYTTQQSKLRKPWHCILFDLSSLSQRTMKHKFQLYLYIFPIKYVIPKSFKVGHWLSEY